MKTIKATFKDGKATFDFEGFDNDDCSKEEKAIRAFLARVGVKTDGTDESYKGDRIPVPNGPVKVTAR